MALKHLTIITSLILAVFLFQCRPAPRGVVSAATPEAGRAGQEILEAGGNAVDAAVAVAFVLGVTEPAMSGLGGGTQMLVGPAGRDPFLINGTTFSPAATPVGIGKDSLVYHRRTTIPSAVRTLHYAWKKYGSGLVSWADCLAPAIRFAEVGFPVGDFRSKVYRRYEDELLNSPHYTESFLIGGALPQEGDTLRQPLLAATLRRLAREGAEDFYRGEIAREIVKDMQANDGWITAEDLRNFPEPREIPAIHTTYGGFDIYTAPPPCGGWVMLLAFDLLRTMNASNAVPERQEKVLEALRLAHLDRRERPVTDLQNYQEDIDEKLDPSYAARLTAAGSFREEETETGGETTHFTVVDPEGNVVSVTASINAYFGAKAASPALGFLYNTYMDDFIFGDTLHPWAIGPGKMAYSSMTPTIVKREGKNVLGLGSPGSARIISAVFQVALNWMEGDRDIQNAVRKPRWHANHPNVYAEDRQDSLALASFVSSAGLTFRPVGQDLATVGLNAYFGGVHAVAFENGRWTGAADPRRDGVVSYAERK